MRKILLLTLLTILGEGASSVKARDVHATLASATTAGSATWTLTESVYTYTWTDTGESRNDYISLFNAFKTGEGTELDWSDGTNFIFTCNGPSSSETNALNVIIVANGSNFSRAMYSDGTKTLTLTATSGDGFRKDGWGSYITAEDLAHVTDIRLQATNKAEKTLTAGSVTVSNLFVQLSPKATLSFNASGVATIDLTKLDVSGSGLSYNSSTGEVTSTEKSGTIFLSFDNADFTNVNTITVNVTTSGDYTDICNTSQVIDAVNGSLNTWYGSRYGMNLAEAEKGYQAKAGQITTIKWNVNAIGTMKINSITMTANAMNVTNAHDVPVASLPHYIVAADGSVSVGAAIATNYGKAADQSLGDGSSNMDEYLDIEDYDELRVYTDDTNDRLFFINETITTGTSGRSGGTLYLSGENTKFSHNTVEGYYYASIATIKEEYGGQAKLIGAKGITYDAKSNISKIQVLKENPTYDYIITGQYSAGVDVSFVTSDASATAVDCSSLSGNNATITPSNPNCLFVARAGVLANDNNVIVSGTCANLALSDGYPFKAPEDFTATAVSYDRSFTADKMTTVCLPFALTSDEASALGTFYGLSSVDGTVITFSEVTEPAANTPYLVIPTNTTLSIVESKSIAATPAETKSSASNIEFIGTLAATGIPASEGSNNYYAFNNGELVRIAENSATLPAFRAYIKATGDVGGVKAFTIQFDDATGVNSLPSMDVAASSKFNVQSSTIFNVAGQRMSKLQKGLNIVNGKKVMVK